MKITKEEKNVIFAINCEIGIVEGKEIMVMSLDDFHLACDFLQKLIYDKCKEKSYEISTGTVNKRLVIDLEDCKQQLKPEE